MLGIILYFDTVGGVLSWISLSQSPWDIESIVPPPKKIEGSTSPKLVDIFVTALWENAP